MTPRVQRLKERLKVEKFPICIEKVRLVTEALQQCPGDPQIIRNAKALAHYLDHRTIFIEDDELLVGNAASKPMGLEAEAPTWPKEDLKELVEGKERFVLAKEDEDLLRSMDDYWRGKGRLILERQGESYDDERLWPFIQSGILCPPWQKKEEGRGFGRAGGGWSITMSRGLDVLDFEKVLNVGFNQIIADAEAELKTIRYTDEDAFEKAYFLKAVIIANNAVVRIAHRYADLAEKMVKEEKNASRKKELEGIARACRYVPGNPSRNFREAMQAFWFTYVLFANGTMCGGRFDQFMYPFYKKDKEAGSITDDEVLELLESLRIKVMQINDVAGGKLQREKWAGMARWNNFVIGGVTPDGEDATNELTYLMLEAAKDCQTPHHTLTLRVHEKTPEELMLKALEVVKTGIGMPAFVGDKSFIEYFTRYGIPIEEARQYALGGCLEANIPGKSGSTMAFGMFLVPLVFEITMNNGIEPRTGRQLGPVTGEFESFKTFDEFMEAFKTQLKYFMGMTVEEHNIVLKALADLSPNPMWSSLMHDAIKVGKDNFRRKLPFENGSCLNPVGMISAADSLAAVNFLIFDEKKITPSELKKALEANWKGYEKLREMCLKAPKYGNGNPYVDTIAHDLYKFWSDTAVTFHSILGGTVKPSGVSITAHGPGGALTGATPDGRYAGENLADGCVSASQGKDTSGPTALMRSAMAIDQYPFQSLLFNLKFHPNALKSDEDLRKLSLLIRTYFSQGGKHVQFNVVTKEALQEAQAHPEQHQDLIVRVAGYSAYYVQLTKAIQDDIISRMEYEKIA